jgi:hypothetical protein
MQKAVLITLLIGLVAFGCSSSDNSDQEAQQTEQQSEQQAVQQTKTERPEIPPPTGDNVSIKYTLTVSGMPMMGDMTFNQRYISDGSIGRTDMESRIPVSGQTRMSKFGTIIDVDNRIISYVNDVSKTYASEDMPDLSDQNQEVAPDVTISVKPNGKVKTVAGVECEGVDVDFNLPAKDERPATSMNGELYVSNNFPGYDTYKKFNNKTGMALRGQQVQTGGFLDFMTRMNVGRGTLDSLYAALGGLAFEGSLNFVLNKGQSNALNMTTNLEVTEVSTDPIDRSLFGIPEDYTEANSMQVMAPVPAP